MLFFFFCLLAPLLSHPTEVPFHSTHFCGALQHSEFFIRIIVLVFEGRKFSQTTKQCSHSNRGSFDSFIFVSIDQKIANFWFFWQKTHRERERLIGRQFATPSCKTIKLYSLVSVNTVGVPDKGRISRKTHIIREGENIKYKFQQKKKVKRRSHQCNNRTGQIKIH